MPFLELSIACKASEEARVETALNELGALSVSLLDAADAENEKAILEPGVGETPLWNDIVLLAPTQVAAEDQPSPAGELGKVMGKDAAALILLLGPPVQDIREGSGRKLQFANTSCIFDVYLYPQGEGETPIAVYTAARVPDGRDAERHAALPISSPPETPVSFPHASHLRDCRLRYRD